MISKLATDIMLSPNRYNGRKHPVTRVTIHHMASVMSARACAAGFMASSRKASANYCIGDDGSICCSVDEANAAWTSNSYDNDNRAITIEVSNSVRGGDWPVGDKAMVALIDLLVDICQRYPSIGQLRYTGDLSGNMTLHKWFAATACPGSYLESKMHWIADAVNKRLGAAVYPPADDTTYTVLVDGLDKKYAENLIAELEADGYKPTMAADKEAEDKPEEDNNLSPLDLVKMEPNAPVWGMDRPFQSWVYSKTLYVRAIHGDRITVSIYKSGAVTGDVDRRYLTKL